MCEDWIARHRARFFALAWGVILLAVAATIGHGLYHGGFPNMSMTFRWHYWQTSAKLIADHPYAGVGRENFGRHYLAHKPIHASEEVSNPHNLPVQVWSELGILGLVATVLMILQASWTIVRSPLVQQSGSVQQRDGPAAYACTSAATAPAGS